MEEPPRIDRILSSRGISLSDASTILRSFLSTLDGNRGFSRDAPPASEAARADRDSARAAADGAPRKSRPTKEETVLEQLDSLSMRLRPGLVSDDTYERLELIRDSAAAEADGAPASPRAVEAVEGEGRGGESKSTVERRSEGEEQDETRRFIEELNAVEAEIARQEGEREETIAAAKKEAKRAKKEKKAAKKARKEAKREKRKLDGENGDGNGGGEKRIKVEMSMSP